MDGNKKQRTSIDHHVHGSSGEKSGFARSEIGGDQMCAVLLPHVRGGVAQGSNNIVGGTRMNMRRQQGAGPQIDHGHCNDDQLWSQCVGPERSLVRPFLRPAAKVAAFMLVTPPGAQL